MGYVVVTGAAGFIGSHLVDRLLHDGRHVVGVDCFADYYDRGLKEANLSFARNHPRFTFLEEDLLSLLECRGNLHKMLREASCVFHLAAQAGVRGSWGPGFRTYLDTNVLATQAVLETCASAGRATVVYASSSSVYGDVDTLPLSEEGPCQPVSPYGVTKLAGEHLCALYGKSRGVRSIALRFFTVYGPRQRPDMAFHKFMRAMIRGESIDLYGSGNQTRDFTYVDDIVAGIIAAQEAPPGSVINVGGGHRITMNEALKTMTRVTGIRPSVRMIEPQAGDAPDTWADLRRARRLLKFAPRTGLDTGLAAEWSWLVALMKARDS